MVWEEIWWFRRKPRRRGGRYRNVRAQPSERGAQIVSVGQFSDGTPRIRRIIEWLRNHPDLDSVRNNTIGDDKDRLFRD